jgi:hypothetical protein
MLGSVLTRSIGQRLRATVLFALGLIPVPAMHRSVFPAVR